jgi:hypothetical protein
MSLSAAVVVAPAPLFLSHGVGICFYHDSRFDSQDRFASVSDATLTGAYSLRVSVRAGRLEWATAF